MNPMEDQHAQPPTETEATVITLCGSTRFEAEFEKLTARLTLDGCLVIGPLFRLPGLSADDQDVDREELRERLGRLHLQRIRMADEVFIVDPGGYLGESTRREIAYAESLGKPIRYLSRERLAEDPRRRW